ncbi:hypothetical protein QVD99_006001 [Batrachochytrium dendrobatidis]|nr:hypothetical protein O5D80_006189 [Batrachochytrium dendrobatidis]KAK5667400.1 hypothetical protein QVD99_006001 [Batrachochytrium dendrobatidis]
MRYLAMKPTFVYAWCTLCTILATIEARPVQQERCGPLPDLKWNSPLLHLQNSKTFSFEYGQKQSRLQDTSVPSHASRNCGILHHEICSLGMECDVDADCQSFKCQHGTCSDDALSNSHTYSSLYGMQSLDYQD